MAHNYGADDQMIPRGHPRGSFGVNDHNVEHGYGTDDQRPHPELEPVRGDSPLQDHDALDVLIARGVRPSVLSVPSGHM